MDDDLRRELKAAILDNSDDKNKSQEGRDKSPIYIKGGAGSINVAGNGNIIINDARRPGERLDDDELQELRDRLDSLARIDAMLAARDPEDRRSHKQRIDAARRRRCFALRNQFRLKSYRNLTHGQLADALAWLEKQKQTALDEIGPAGKRRVTQTRPIRNALRLLSLGFLAIAVPLIFSVERTRPPAPTATVPIAAIAAGQVPTIQSATELLTVQPEPGFHFHAGCSFFKPSQPSFPKAANQPYAI